MGSWTPEFVMSNTAIPSGIGLTSRLRRGIFSQRPVVVVSACFLIGLVLLAWIVPVLSPYGAEQGGDAQFSPPDLSHWFGTDVHGRDLFTRVFAGARISLLVGVVGTSVSLLIGVSWGMVAGYFGGRLDGLLMRIVDILYSLPGIVLVIVLITTLEPTVKAVAASSAPSLGRLVRVVFLFIGLGAVSWLTMARIIRGQVLSLRTRSFVLASRALGAGPLRILRRHIFPNVVGITVVYLTLTVPAIILYESFLSYLGLGIQPPEASLGTLIAEGAGEINPLQINWWLVVCPGAVLSATLLALSFVGDGLKNALDPKSPG